jgi:succinyldiaminopimelate transaminase
VGLADLSDLPFPWDTLVPAATRARSHPRGIVDLSVGTPVDPTPALVQDALAGAGDAHGYPTTHGTPALREAVSAWFARRRGVDGLDPAAVLPTIGSKEIVALLPSLLSLGAGDVVVHPAAAYPTYDVGARLAGATALATSDVSDWEGRHDVRLVWVNSPGNPTGEVLSVEELARVVRAARAVGAVVVSDECYAELAWDEPWSTGGVPSILDPRVNGGSHEGLLAAYSLSKQSNLAGYRSAFVAGDPALVARPGRDRRSSRRRHPRRRPARGLQSPPRRSAPGAAVLRPRGRRLSRRSVPLEPSRRCRTWRPRRVGDRRRPGRSGHPRGTWHLLRVGGGRSRAGGSHGDRRAHRRGSCEAHLRLTRLGVDLTQLWCRPDTCLTVLW